MVSLLGGLVLLVWTLSGDISRISYAPADRLHKWIGSWGKADIFFRLDWAQEIYLMSPNVDFARLALAQPANAHSVVNVL